MLKSIDIYVQLETGNHIAIVDFSDGVSMVYTLINMTGEVMVENLILTSGHHINIHKYFRFFHNIINLNISDNITRLKLYFYDDDENIAFESWKKCNGSEIYSVFERVIKNTSKINIDNYKNIKDDDITVETLNILSTKYNSLSTFSLRFK